VTVALVQSKVVLGTGGATFDSATTAGNLLLCVFTERDTIGSPRVGPTGWTLVAHIGDAATDATSVWYKIASGSETSVTVSGPTNHNRQTIAEFSGDLTLVDTARQTAQFPATTYPTGTVDMALSGLLVNVTRIGDTGPHFLNLTADPSFTVVATGECDSGFDPTDMLSYRVVAAGTYGSTCTGSLTDGSWGALLIAFEDNPPFTADFSGSPRTGEAPLTVDFTEESYGGTGTPTSWAWTFGDGGTSTSQDPTHVYTSTGSWTVSLTVTTDDAESDTETKTGYVTVGAPYVAPAPSGALIEIRAASPGSYRWGIALWGVGTWSAAGWQDVTPQSVDAVVRWGSHQPGYGVLAETEAGSWIVDTYDPERLLDPGNADGPYHADLRAGLPIRIRHRGTIIRQGVAESILFQHADTVGGIRVTDAVSILARTPVPEDSVLSDTLRARARDAIAAAGLRVTVEPDPPGGDPALAPRLEDERSVWRHIADAAQQVLHLPYVDRVGTLRFRPWATPYDRARGVDERQLVDLGTLVTTAGLYSVVRAQQTVGDGGLVIERRSTPVPRYGPVTYERSDATPDADDWAEAVLADRSLQTVQWIPGEIFPLDAEAVESFATLEAMERFGVDHSMADPPVDITGVIVGGTITITSRRGRDARWGFELELAQTADSPLYFDATDPPQFMLNETGDGYLYGD
jgi:PKD repeat protein